MSTFQEKIQDYIGVVSDTTALSDWLTTEARKLVDLIPIRLLEQFSTSVPESGSGVSIQNLRFIRAHKSGYYANEIDPGLKAQAIATLSIHLATTTSPIVYIEGGYAYIKPGGGTIVGVQYPYVAYDNHYIGQFPIQFERLVVLGAAIQGATAKVGEQVNNLATLISSGIAALTAPTVPSDPAFTYTEVTATSTSPASVVLTASVPIYIAPTETISYTNIATYIATEEDLEKAQTELGHQKLKIDQYQNTIQDSVGRFNQSIKVYETDLQLKIENARLLQQEALEEAQRTDNVALANKAKVLEQQAAEYRSKLEKFGSEVQRYGASVTESVQNNATKVQGYQIMTQNLLMLLTTLKQEYRENLSTYIPISAKGEK